MISFKRGSSALLSGVMAFSCVSAAFAATPNSWDGEYTHNQKEGSDSQVDVNVLVQNRTVPVIFSAYVPATVKIAVSRDKQIITPENLRIINGVDTLPIGVWDIYAKPVNGWKLMDWNTNFKDKALADQKKFAMTMNGNDLKYYAKGLPWEIEAAGELPLNLDAKITYQSQAKDLEEIMTVSFTMDWMDRFENPNQTPHARGTVMSKSRLDSLAKNLTGTIKISTEKHDPSIHGEGVDVSEAQDGSVMCVVKGQNATVYGQGGVKCPNVPNYWNSSRGGYSYGIFANYYAKTIDVSGLDTSAAPSLYCMFYNTAADKVIGLDKIITENTTDITGLFYCARGTGKLDFTGVNTSNVVDMGWMFHTCYATDLMGLSSFNTSKVKSTWEMFENAYNITSLDLSSFDMSNISDTSRMFAGCNPSTIYCRNEHDKQLMINSSSRTPSSTAFVVGHPGLV